MRRTNWSNVSKNTKILKRNVKNIQALGEYLQNIPEEGLFRDNISKNIVVIKDCKSSSLRRYSKLLENYYYLVTSERDRRIILNKKNEVDAELDTREDGILKKNEGDV